MPTGVYERRPCAPDCMCGKHNKPKLPREEKLRRNRARMAAHRQRVGPEHYKDMRLQSAFGISLAKFKQLLEGQNFGCAICGTGTPGGKGDFHVDHDHSCCPGKRSCGKCVRGLLCTRCNAGIAFFQDSPEIMQKAIQYVSR